MRSLGRVAVATAACTAVTWTGSVAASAQEAGGGITSSNPITPGFDLTVILAAVGSLAPLALVLYVVWLLRRTSKDMTAVRADVATIRRVVTTSDDESANDRSEERLSALPPL